MDRLKKARRPVRASITKLLNDVTAELQKDEPSRNVLECSLLKLEDVSLKLGEFDQQVLDKLLDDDTEEDVYEAEYADIDSYQDKVRDIRIMIKKVISPNTSRSGSPAPSTYSTAASETPSGNQTRNYKLPKIEIKKFDGQLKNWLGFWSQFKKIHEDATLHDSDKFQYLVQSMVTGTRAQKLVESYPQSSDNYSKVIEALQSRFGDKVLLAEVYVRELLKFVNSSMHKKRDKDSLGALYDELESHLRALETLGVKSEHSAIFLYPMVESSLPEEFIKIWQRSSLSGYAEDVEKSPEDRLMGLLKFLRQEVKGAERLSLVKAGLNDMSLDKSKQQQFTKKRFAQEIPTVAGLHVGEKAKCIFCEKIHDSEKCYKARGLSLAEKQDIVKKKHCCYLCLKPGHIISKCTSNVNCGSCGKKHSVVICPDSSMNQKHDLGSKKKSSEDEMVKSVNSCVSITGRVALGILNIKIAEKGMTRTVRAFFDIGSQRSYIKRSVVNDLRLQPNDVQCMRHVLFGGTETDTKRYFKYHVKAFTKDRKELELKLFGTDQICGEIARLPQGPWTSELKQVGIDLNDSNGNSEVEMLIGADIYGKLLTGRIHQLKRGLTAMETLFGWIVTGEYDSHESSLATSVISMHITNARIEELWSLETLGIRDPEEAQLKGEIDTATKAKFVKTVTRMDDGRYQVSLPWTDGQQKIPNNKGIAETRLMNTTRKLVNAGKYKEYDAIFNSWLDEEIIEEVTDSSNCDMTHYLPHRPVFKLDSTTPTRPVFDASCKNGRAPSLNECLEKGPNLLDFIPSILMRFREGKLGITSDIRKAFLMVGIKEEDRDFLRFLWWQDQEQKTLKIFRHRRVVFGLNCGPFLLSAVIEMHLNAVEEDKRAVASKLLSSLYVDNCVTSVDSYEEYEYFKEEATKLMADCKMELRLWTCSGEESGVGLYSSCERGLETGRENQLQSVLGLRWDRFEDSLSCVLDLDQKPERLTKRKLLSLAHKIFDPLGFFSPVLICANLILQETWLLKTGWDEELSSELCSRFGNWYEELHKLKNCDIPRNMTGKVSDRSSWEIHTFCDASKDAYATVVYLRTEVNGVNGVSVQLMQSKSRVAPVKSKKTIPRLELLACVLGARLTDVIKKALALENVPIVYWTDSSTALAWIQRNDEWGTFVGNRVREIVRLSNSECWRHVPGHCNPADLPSRGCSPTKLLESRWWEGPIWLKDTPDTWPSGSSECNLEEILAEKKKIQILSLVSMIKDSPWYTKRSSFSSNVRIIGWMRRFINNCSKNEPKSGFLKVQELKEAELILIKLVQDVFEKVNGSVNGIKVEKDNAGLLRVSTKLLYRKDTLDFRSPILLPHRHPIVDQLIREIHVLNGHAGVQLTLSQIREKYWILQGRKAVRRITQNCVTCRRFTSKKVEVTTAALPEDRVKTAKVFEIVGVDLAGPLYLKEREKAYIVLFTCGVFRCIHLEVVKSLSTEAFLDALSRFMSRRGRPAIIYSDNGTNFVGANNLFKAIDWKKVEKQSAISRIQWKFSPPGGPWWGGWWERLVKSVKEPLRRILGNKTVTMDKLCTYMCEVEAYINARPLTTLTEDPNDLAPLKPSMFLQEIPYTNYTELDFLSAKEFQDGIKQRKTVLDEFKMRFRKEYLSLLVQRGKEKGGRQIKLGDVVLIETDSKKRWDWPMAKVIEVYPGKDNVVRVVKVKTAAGTLVRPVQRLFPLEVTASTEIPRPAKKVEVVEVPTTVPDEHKVRTRSGRLIKKPDRL